MPQGFSRTAAKGARLRTTVALAPMVFATMLVPAGAQTAESAGDPRVDALVRQMTTAEKIDVIRGVQEAAATDQGEAGYLGGVPRLGIPSLRFADGPPGVLTRVPSIALPATMALAATFSRDDARANGAVIAHEAARLGIDVALQPFINIMRDISFGRGWNTFGEDPFLTGKLAAAQVEGIQSQGVMAQAKHFVGYDMNGYKAAIGAQALHEIYYAPFQDVVDAGVSSIMCAYNQVNGAFACGNPQILNRDLRGEMGFKGYVTSDWGATHKPQDINAGLDMEMPGLMPPGSPWLTITRSYYDGSMAPVPPLTMTMTVLAKVFARSMPEDAAPPSSTNAMRMHGQFPDDPAPQDMAGALSDGSVAMATIDRAAWRVLHEMNRFGYLDGKTHQPTGAAPNPADQQVILKTADDAAVLLKNEGGVLPLRPADFRDLAVVGPGAAQVVALGINAEHALGIPADEKSPYAVLRDRHAAQGDRVTLAVADDMTGTPVPAALWSQDGQPGLVRYDGKAAVGRDAQINFTVAGGNALAADSEPHWQGTIDIPADGTYGLYLQVLGTNAEISIDGKEIGHTSSMTGARHGDTVQAGQDNLLPTTDGLDNVRRDVALTAGKHLVQIALHADTSHAPVQVRLAWKTPQQQQAEVDAAVAAASHARKAIVFAWARQSPTFALPGRQNELIERIAAANPNTIVVLNTSLPVAMPWLGKVKAVVNMWWPGDRGGEATADVLEGRVSPAGRLPFTWAARLSDYPTFDPAHPERGLQIENGEVTYSEGIDVGYRWFARQGIKPLFPFGYGQSYGHFAYAGLSTKAAPDGGVIARFTLRNTGHVAADEVPQVYLAAPAQTRVPVARLALAGFDRVHLAPGEARRVAIRVPRRSFQYWDSASATWRTVEGHRTLLVGGNATDTPLRAEVSPTA